MLASNHHWEKRRNWSVLALTFQDKLILNIFFVEFDLYALIKVKNKNKRKGFEWKDPWLTVYRIGSYVNTWNGMDDTGLSHISFWDMLLLYINRRRQLFEVWHIAL